MRSGSWKMPEAEIRALHKRYWAGESPQALEAETPYKKGGLTNAFRNLGLPSRGRTDYIPLDDPRARKALDLWDRGSTAKAAGETVGISQTIMSRLLKETGRTGQRWGPEHAAWKGGRGISTTGYVHVWVSIDDPMASMRHDDSHVFEHRLVMARHLGRPLLSHETVHHLNGIRDDNRITNLQLRTGPHGSGGDWCCADCGSSRLKPQSI